MDSYMPTGRTEVRRLEKRAVYEKAQVYAILDEGSVCHVGFVAGGQPYVIPTLYARAGDRIYIHGSPASRMLRALEQGADVCLTVTLVDGLVLASSACHHSMNYRSVVVFGKARPVTDPEEKMEALRTLTNHLAPGGWEIARKPNPQDMEGTCVMALPLDEVSAKMRAGPALDTEEDYSSD
jgi:uncharacterized protein